MIWVGTFKCKWCEELFTVSNGEYLLTHLAKHEVMICSDFTKVIRDNFYIIRDWEQIEY